MIPEDDHRNLGARLDLFHFQEEAPGAVFWHPRGLVLFRILEDCIRRRIKSEDYLEVRSPQLFSESLWRRSGHWDKFKENLFIVLEDDQAYAIKPVSCPAHIELVKRMAPSHKSLPLRLGEFGLCHRKERSGALQGLFRLFQFTQDDGHIFCAEDHVEQEVVRFTNGLLAFYHAFGFDEVRIGLSLRPEVRAGSDEVWDRAEQVLESAIRSTGLPFERRPGGGAFYGPKLEFDLQDAHGRSWTCGTIQLDFVLPERFDLSYANAQGEASRMVMLHRALIGALERFMAILLEHLGGVVPPWLAPEQVVVAPLSEAHIPHAQELMMQLERSGLRPRLDCRRESISRKVFDAQALAIPWFIAFGDREMKGGALTLRQRNGQNASLEREDAIREMVEASQAPEGLSATVSRDVHGR